MCQGYVPLTLDVVRVALRSLWRFILRYRLTGFEPMTDLCATAGVRSCDGFSHGPEMFGRYTGFPWNLSGSWAVCSIYGALRQDCLARNVCHVGVVISR